MYIGIALAAAMTLASLVWYGCTKEEELKGTIYGTVTDYSTGSPIGNASVKLRPSGETTLTGSDGTYEFKDLDAGKYSLLLSKAEYADLDDDYIIELEAGKKVKRDVQMRKQIASLQIVDMNGNPLDTLDFGDGESVTVKSFNIFNNGTEKLSCSANYECEWITNVSGLENDIPAGQTVPVTVRIDRVALADGVNTTFLYIISGNGSNEVVVKATFKGTVAITTAQPTSVTATSATVGGNITDDGGRPVTARGICYGTSQTPTIDGDHTEDGSGTGTFSHNITGLSSSTTYYARAYATNRNGTYYSSNIVSFITADGMPTVTTTDVTDVTSSSAKSGGNVTNNGGFNVTARGVCWNTLGSPDLNDDHTTNGSGNGAFTSNITGIALGTTYYVRAYATNQSGTSYGEEKTFSTPSGNVTIVFSEPTDITASSATCTANITDDGGAPIASRGFCWATTQYPTTESSQMSLGMGNGSFTGTITGLQPATTYYVRAFAVNQAGTAYSTQHSFTTGSGLPTITTTTVSDITANSAKSGGNITDNGGFAVTARGVCWNTMGNPDLNGDHTNNGSGNGTFTSNMTNLSPNTTYHVRAYATNSTGTVYGAEQTFTTSSGMPQVTTGSVSNVTATTAVCGGNVTSDGGFSVTARGICWNTVGNPDISGSHTTNGTGTGSFSANITDLTPGTTYHVRAYATNSTGTSYGTETTFTTSSGSVTMTIAAATNITATSATCNVNITNDGGAAITERGICWSTAQYPTTAGSSVAVGSGTGSFTASMSALSLSTTYYVRAYAINTTGTSYSSQISFTTADGLPTVTTGSVSNITAETATCSGNVTSDGGFAVTANGFCWSTSQYPTISGSHTNNGSGTGSFNGSLTNLEIGTTYYVRAYATNSAGTSYGSQVSFSTGSGLPTVTTTTPTISGTTVNTGGQVTDDGGYSVISRGIVYSPLPYPDLGSAPRTIDGSGTGYFSSSFTLPMGSGTYYVRAYALNENGDSYGEQFTVIQPYDELPTFTYNGHTYKVAPDPGENMSHTSAQLYCNNLSYCGYSDWIMPDEGEMQYMCTQKYIIGGFSIGNTTTNAYLYWTSTDGGSIYKYVCMDNCTLYSGTSVFGVTVSNSTSYGYNNYGNNSFYFRVRPIRIDN